MEPDTQFLDLSLRRDGDIYRVIARSPDGESKASFKAPFTPAQASAVQEHRYREIFCPAPSGGQKYIPSTVHIAHGDALFATLMQGGILGFFLAGCARAKHTASPMRVRILFEEVPELEELPWEYMHSLSDHSILSISLNTPLSRSRQSLRRIPPIQSGLPLKLLVISSSPRDLEALDHEAEITALLESAYGLKKEKLLDYRVEDHASLSSVLRLCESTEFHVIHFIGHGVLDKELGRAFVLLEDEHRNSVRVPANRLAAVLRASKRSPLVVLNACDTAKSPSPATGRSVTQELSDAGFPAVVAMRDPITDRAARIFAESFYRAIATGEAVDVATNRARLAIYADRSAGLEWATPVLYLGVESGRLFDIQPARGFFGRIFGKA